MNKTVLFLLALLALPVMLSAAELKRGYVNMETLFNEYYKTINENITFETRQRTVTEGFQLLRTEMENTMKEYKKAEAEAQNELLSNDARAAAQERARLLADRLQQKQTEIYKYREESLRDIQNRQQQVTDSLVGELIEQVRKYAADKNYDEIVEVSGKTMSRVQVLLVYPKDKEITAEIVKIINAGHEKEKQDAQARLAALRARAQQPAAK
ncbi:MAG: OmpH family outer membrane protein [Victivallales bacterium]|nr:OmpH family outer membrane protein [Victivallales bacterium]